MEFIETSHFTKLVYVFLTETELLVFRTFFFMRQNQVRLCQVLAAFAKLDGKSKVTANVVVCE